MRKPYFIFSIIFFFVSMLYLYLSSYSEASLRWALNNSDLLFPFSIYQNVVSPTRTPVWVFGGYTPFIEVTFGFLLWLPVRNIPLTLILYAAFQLCFILAAAIYLAHCIFGKNWKIFSSITFIFSIAIIIAAAGYLNYFNFLFYWYMHISTFAMGLVALGLLIQSLTMAKNGRRFWISLALLSLIGVIGTVSDALFVAQFVAPALILIMCTVIIGAVRFRRAAITALTVLYSTALGLLIFNVPNLWGSQRMFLNGYYLQTTILDVKGKFLSMLDNISSVWQGHVLVAVVWFSFYILCVVLTVIITRRWAVQKKGTIRLRLGMGLFFFLIQLVTTLSAELISSEPVVRYILPVVFIPLFAGWPFLASGFPRWMKFLLGRVSYIMGAILIGLASFFMILNLHPANKVSNLWNFYPDNFQCLDENLSGLKLHYGIAQYWQARPMTLFSKSGLLVVQVMPNLEPFPILSNLNDYQDKFEFIILDYGNLTPTSIDRGLVLQRFGAPATSFICSTYEVLVYNRASDAAFAHQFSNFNFGQ